MNWCSKKLKIVCSIFASSLNSKINAPVPSISGSVRHCMNVSMHREQWCMPSVVISSVVTTFGVGINRRYTHGTPKQERRKMTNIRSGSKNTCKIPSEDTQTIEQTFEGAWTSTEPDGGSTNNVYIETVPVNYIYLQTSITWATEVGFFFPKTIMYVILKMHSVLQYILSRSPAKAKIYNNPLDCFPPWGSLWCVPLHI